MVLERPRCARAVRRAVARAVLLADDEIDDLYRELIDELNAAAREHPEWLEPIIQLLQVSRFLERLADHATNIAEDVIYMVEGEIPRHSVKRAVAEAMGLNGQAARPPSVRVGAPGAVYARRRRVDGAAGSPRR